MTFEQYNPPLHKHASIVIRHNYNGDGLYDAVAVGCKEKPECKGATRLEALIKLEEKITALLPKTETGDEQPTIKSNTLHIGWKK